jgi:hypothetical protein
VNRRLVADDQVNAYLNHRLSRLCEDLGFPADQWKTWHREDETAAQRAAIRAVSERLQEGFRAIGAHFRREPHRHHFVLVCDGCGIRHPGVTARKEPA